MLTMDTIRADISKARDGKVRLDTPEALEDLGKHFGIPPGRVPWGLAEVIGAAGGAWVWIQANPSSLKVAGHLEKHGKTWFVVIAGDTGPSFKDAP